MAVTTNYNWTTPDDTSLVKDGASAIRTLGSSVDTTVKNLNPETTLGDISYRSSTANVKTRLALGTAGQVLTVNSGATAPEWGTVSANGMTLISTTTLSGVTTTLSSIPQTYVNLQLVIEGYTGNTGNSFLRIAPNGTTNATASVITEGFEASGNATSDFWSNYLYPNSLRSTTRTDANNVSVIVIYNYTSSTGYKPFKSASYIIGTDNKGYFSNGAGTFVSNTAISSFDIQYGGTNSFAGGTVKLYGVK